MKNYSQIKKMFSFIRKNPLSCILFFGFAIAIIKLLSLYNSIEVDDGHWQKFKVEHACVEQLGDKGNQRLSWKCDDGEIYFRWRQQR
jgi:hypothetical protein